MTTGVYIIANKKDGKVYVGSSERSVFGITHQYVSKIRLGQRLTKTKGNQ